MRGLAIFGNHALAGSKIRGLRLGACHSVSSFSCGCVYPLAELAQCDSEGRAVPGSTGKHCFGRYGLKIMRKQPLQLKKPRQLGRWSWRLAGRLLPRSWRGRLIAAMGVVALAPLLAVLLLLHASLAEFPRQQTASDRQAAAARLASHLDASLSSLAQHAHVSGEYLAAHGVLEQQVDEAIRAQHMEWCRKMVPEPARPFFQHLLLMDATGTLLLEHGAWHQAMLPVYSPSAAYTAPGGTGFAILPAGQDTPGNGGQNGLLLLTMPVSFSPGADGRLPGQGRIVMEYKLQYLQQQLTDAVASGWGEAFVVVVNATNHVVAAGEWERQPVSIEAEQPVQPRRQLLHSVIALDYDRQEATITLGAEGEAVSSSDPSKFFAASAPLRHAPWRVVLLQPESAVRDAMQDFWRALLQVGLLTGVLAMICGVWFATTLMRPVRQLTHAARRVAAGDLQAVAPVTGVREIVELSQAFNAMTQRLVRRLEGELLVAKVSRSCLQGGTKEASAIIDEVLGMVGEFLVVDCVFTVIETEHAQQEGLLQEGQRWDAEQFDTPNQEPLLPAGVDATWLWRQVQQQGQVRVPDVAKLPESAAAIKDVLRRQGVRSMAAAAIPTSKGLRGALLAGVVLGRRAFTDDEVNVLAMAGEMLGNVVERHEAQQALLASEERYAMAQRAANIGSWEWDIATGHLYWSEAIAPMFGFTPGEFSGTYKAFLERVHPDDRKLVLDAVGASFRHGVDYNVEHRIVRDNGSERWVAEAGEVVRDAQGNPERMRGILQDITERKWAEEALARLNRRLEQLVEARTKDLGQKALELEEANRRLLELDEMKTTFLTSVSHELRTPLTSILGFAKLVSKEFSKYFMANSEAPPATRKRERRVLENLEIIGQEGGRLTRLINDLLDLAKIEAGKVQWRDKSVSPEVLIMRAVRAVSGQYAQKPDVKLHVEVEEALPNIVVDDDRMTQVLINLLHNANKFTTEGTVRLVAHMPDPMTLRVRVEDSGQGIQAPDLSRIFEKFHQGATSDTLHAKPEGTGLGLAISKQIVEHYHGVIWAESIPGQGSAFIFELPLPTAADASFEPESAPQSG